LPEGDTLPDLPCGVSPARDGELPWGESPTRFRLPEEPLPFRLLAFCIVESWRGPSAGLTSSFWTTFSFFSLAWPMGARRRPNVIFLAAFRNPPPSLPSLCADAPASGILPGTPP